MRSQSPATATCSCMRCLLWSLIISVMLLITIFLYTWPLAGSDNARKRCFVAAAAAAKCRYESNDDCSVLCWCYIIFFHAFVVLSRSEKSASVCSVDKFYSADIVFAALFGRFIFLTFLYSVYFMYDRTGADPAE